MKYLYNILLILSTVFFFSCQENDELAGDNEIGYLRLTVANDASTTTRADIPENYNPEQIAVQIIDSDGSVVEETDDFSEWKDRQIEVPAGNYTIKASSANWDGGAAGFDAPYYTGSTEVKVLGSQEVNATVTCTLANVKVTVNYDDELLAKVKSVATVVRSEDRIYQQNFSSTEKRSAYYPVTALVAEVTVINNDGESNTLSQELGSDTGVQARDHFILNIHAQETGPSNINVTVDPTTHEYSYTFNVSTVPTNGATVIAGAWDNIIYLKAENITAGSGVSLDDLKFQYRVASAQTKAETDSDTQNPWIDVETTVKDGICTAFITNLTAATEYQYRLVNGVEEEIQAPRTIVTETVPESGVPQEQLQNASFEQWSTVKAGLAGTVNTAFPNAAGDSYWDTSNKGANSISRNDPTSSVTEPVVDGTYAAKLESKSIYGVLAAASLYTGTFGAVDFSSFGATLTFGQSFSSRPIALQGYYKYIPKNVDTVGDNLPEDATVSSGQPDQCSIYIALAKKSYEINNKDEDTFINFEEDENIIAYGALPSGAATSGEGYTQFTIPLQYKESQFGATPTHIIVVCSASKYGDYMTGGVGSTLYVDDFSLIYDGTPAIWENK